MEAEAEKDERGDLAHRHEDRHHTLSPERRDESVCVKSLFLCVVFENPTVCFEKPVFTRVLCA